MSVKRKSYSKEMKCPPQTQQPAKRGKPPGQARIEAEPGGENMTVKRKQYSKEFKFKVVMQLIKGEETQQQICSQHEIQASVLQRWKKQFMENGADVFEEGTKNKTGHDATSEKMGPLERKIGHLTMELDFAKKVLERSI